MLRNLPTLTPSHIYTSKEIKKAMLEAGAFEKVTNNKKVTYYNAPLAFDIETTSFFVQSNGQDEKRAIMYIWTLSINGVIVQGRTWPEWVETCRKMSEFYDLNETKRLVIYIHNLGYEFQFMHKWFEWIDVFALEERNPIRALCTLGIEFRCSLKLSGYRLEKVGENLQTYHVKKLVGDLDYNKIRNHNTPLTEEENAYCVNDVQVVVAYIQEYIDNVKFIYEIPMTKTGVVRKYTRKQCFYGGGKRDENKEVFKRYKKLMDTLVLSVDDYEQLKKAFAGGFTHANALWVNNVVKNVKSQDFTSSYPTVMIAEQYPMSAPRNVQLNGQKDFENYLNNFCCLFDIEFYNLRPHRWNENYISKSHCTNLSDFQENNGRIVSAGYLKTTITELDYFIIEAFYDWDNVTVSHMKIMDKGYLPRNYVKSIIKFYKDKTQLKEVVGKEAEYLSSKEMLNSLYGMMVTDVCRDKISYSPDEWTTVRPPQKRK